MVRLPSLPSLALLLVAPGLTPTTALALDIIPLDYATLSTNGSGELPIGGSLASGDLDGDGTEDLVLGAPGADSVLVFFQKEGSSDWLALENAVTLPGESGSGFGTGLAIVPSLRTAGAQLAVGAPSSATGSVFIYDGASLSEGSRDGLTPQVTLTGSAQGGGFGQALAAAYVGESGYLAVGAPNASAGGVTLYRVANLESSVLSLSRAGEELGTTLAIGDFDGDGTPDLAAGAPGSDAGSLYLLTNIDSAIERASTADFTAQVIGEGEGARFGDALALTPPLTIGTGDSKTPGHNLLVGSPGYDNGDGLLDVLAGSQAVIGGASSDIRVYASSTGGVTMGLGQSAAYIGSIEGEEDVIAIGAPITSSGGCSRCGAAYILPLSGLTVKATPVSVLDNARVMVQGHSPGVTAGAAMVSLESGSGPTVAIGAPGIPASSLVAAVGSNLYIDEDGDGASPAEGDCDDSDPAISLDASESCNELDDDCDGTVDEDASSIGYVDTDGDGYGAGDPVTFNGSCELPDDYAPVDGDCAENDETINPGATEVCNGSDDNCNGEADEGPVQGYLDSDGDGFGVGAPIDAESCNALGDGYASAPGDCDDSSGDTYPNAMELCDLKDNDCNEVIDDDYVTDRDGDGYYIMECGGTDCDDDQALTYPGAEEICDVQDNDCDSDIDEGLDQDLDGDGQSICEGDCDDSDPDRTRDGTEVCDGKDNDCNEVVDDPFDLDFDGDPDPALCPALGGDCDDSNPDMSSLQDEICDEGQALDNDCDGNVDEFVRDDVDNDGFTSCAGDCDDSNPDISPVGSEICNEVDDDCDGLFDEGVNEDSDGDGLSTCEGDCDDTDSEIFPNAEERCDGEDNDCDGDTDEEDAVDGPCDQYEDQDGDDYPANVDCDDEDRLVYPGAPETCDGKDSDCDGELREDELDGDGDGNLECYNGIQDQDCDDTDPTVYVGAEELCDNKDNDCNGSLGTDEVDSDRDGVLVCEGDCDDRDRTIGPDEEETCDGEDEDCDGDVDEGLDGDRDGFCGEEDCDDTNPDINAGGVEIMGNDTDEDCDGVAADQDGDGYCLQQSHASLCEAGIDCDDSDEDIYPEADTLEDDGIDQDCDGDVDEIVPTPIPTPTQPPTPTPTPGPVAVPDPGLNGSGSNGVAFSCSQGAGQAGASWLGALLLLGALGGRRRRG